MRLSEGKFQGQEAPVVFYPMANPTAVEARCGMEFLVAPTVASSHSVEFSVWHC
jgi:hypothetical protein